MRRNLLALLLLAAAASPARAVKVESITGVLADGRVLEVVSEQALIRFSTAATPAERANALRGAGARVLTELPSVGWTVVELPAGTRVLDGLRLLRALPGVLSADVHHVYRPDRIPNDPLVSSQYALSQVNAFSGWEYEVGTSCRATVAIVDSGIQGGQSELSGKLVSAGTIKSKFFDPNSAGAQSDNDPPTPACNHATRTAGIAAASSDNGTGIAGMSWGAQLISLKVFADGDCNPTGSCPSSCLTSDASLVNAIDYARSIQNTAAAGKVVLNLSLGGAGSCSGAVQTALNNAVAAGIPIAISAGNDGSAVNNPANCATTTGGAGIIPVGATDSNNNIPAFSSRGPELAANGVVAPGVAVLTTDLNGATASPSGTSFSAPHVAGLAALILSAKPLFTAAEVQAAIRGGAEGIGIASLGLDEGGRPLGNTSGAGRLNAFRTMRLAVKGTLADFEGDQKAIAFPNPFRTSQTGTVSFTVPTSLQGADTKIKVYTISGEFVRELTGLTWDGKNKEGVLVASGTYIFLVSTDKGRTRGRVAVIR